jgi:hypothetical protein
MFQDVPRFETILFGPSVLIPLDEVASLHRKKVVDPNGVGRMVGPSFQTKKTQMACKLHGVMLQTLTFHWCEFKIGSLHIL